MSRIIHACLLVVVLAFVGFTAAHALDAADLPKAVENAKTAADHEAIASYWDEQAKEARAKAATHRQMGLVYKKRPPASPKSGGSGNFGAQMETHCDKLVKQYEQGAANYDAMAAGHRAEAKAAAK